MEYVEGTTALRYFREMREYLNPLLKESKFKETGVLTAEEFVLAGDFLVFKCPTWAWAAGQSNKRKDYLPADKQYLVTRNVPCQKRVVSMENECEDRDDEDEDGEWVATHRNRVPQTAAANVRDISDEIAFDDSTNAQPSISADPDAIPENIDDIPDMDEELELVEMVEEGDDPAAMQPDNDDGKFVKTRTYDMSITYDKYYQTPRVFLFGYDENRKPLTPQQIFEDISQDHAKKTVTIESHPHESLSLASIHPCKHGNVMKRLLDQMVESGKEEIRVDQYLLLFLKFMSSVLPTMEYDYTGDGF